MEKEIEKFMIELKKMSDFYRVKFVILFGSRILGVANKMSDYDFSVYYDGNKYGGSRFAINANFSEKFDVKIFQDLPLFIMNKVLKGKKIYVSDERLLYDIAYETIKRFENFKKYYYDYISRRPIII